MRIFPFVPIASLLVACSGAVHNPDPAPAATAEHAEITPGPTPVQCAKTDRHGVYLFTFTTISGDCGAVPASLVNFDDAVGVASCTSSGVTWSEGDCKKTATERCPADGTSPAFEATVVTTQETQDGSVMDGVETLDAPGPGGCLGTYKLHGVRQ